MFETRIPERADLNRGIKKTYLNTVLTTGDKKAHRVDVSLYRGDESFTPPSGTVVSSYFIRYSDNKTVPLGGSVSGNVASVTLEQACYSKPGQFALIIKIASSTEISTVFYGEGSIFTNTTDTVIDPGDVIPSLEDLLAQIAAMEAATSAANTATSKANTATTKANNAASAANTAAAKIDGMTVAAAAASKAGATISEKNGVKHIDFKLPKGDTGAVPDITFNAVTGAPGTDVQVYQSGTAESPVVTLTIPRGTPGEGAVDSVCGVYPEPDGNVPLTAEKVGALPIAGGSATGPVSAQKLTSWTNILIKSGNWEKMLFQDGTGAQTGKISSYTNGDGNGSMSFAVNIPGTDNLRTYRLPEAKPSESASTKYILTAGSEYTLNAVYPVGAIYLSTASTSPASLFGGTWERLKDRFLLAAGDTYSAGSTGGEASHTLTENELPNVTGQANLQFAGGTAGIIASASGALSVGGSEIGVATTTAQEGTTNVRYRYLNMNIGGGAAHNNMPPYLAVYIWKRTA